MALRRTAEIIPCRKLAGFPSDVAEWLAYAYSDFAVPDVEDFASDFDAPLPLLSFFVDAEPLSPVFASLLSDLLAELLAVLAELLALPLPRWSVL